MRALWAILSDMTEIAIGTDAFDGADTIRNRQFHDSIEEIQIA
jgi:hypothetical protein